VVSGGTQFGEQVQPIAVGKAEIEDCGIVGRVCQRFSRVCPYPDGVNDEFAARRAAMSSKFGSSSTIKTHRLTF
jgi:hypothetical protein